MRRSTHPMHAPTARRPCGAEPLRMRLVPMLCVLLISFGACVQASHVHDDGGPTPWKSSQNSQHKSPDGAPGNSTDHCLLCVVMHAAMPSAHGAAPTPVRHTQPDIPSSPIARCKNQVSFDLFSRPPPARSA